MSWSFLVMSIKETIEVFFMNTASFLLAFSLFRTQDAARKEYEEIEKDTLTFSYPTSFYEEDGKYYVADNMQRMNRKEISMKDYMACIEYDNYHKNKGIERVKVQIKSEHIYVVLAILSIIFGSMLSIDKMINSIGYAVLITFLYVLVGIVIVFIVKMICSLKKVVEPIRPESVMEFIEENYHIDDI